MTTLVICIAKLMGIEMYKMSVYLVLSFGCAVPFHCSRRGVMY